MRLRSLMAALCLALSCLCAHAQSGWVTVNASSLEDSSGSPINNATISFAPVNALGKPIDYQAAGGGQVVTSPVVTQVNNGQFSLKVADTNLTKPQNICYSVTVQDNVSGSQLLGSGYGCVQPAYSNTWCSAGTCTFDDYVPATTVGTQPGGVISVNGVTGPLIITGAAVSQSGNTLTIGSTSGGGTTINNIGGPFTFTGAGVTQNGSTFTFLTNTTVNGDSGALTFSGPGVSQSGTTFTFSGMTYPASGIAVSSGSGWGTSLAAPASALVGVSDTQTLTNKTVDGVTPTTMGYLDATSSIQTQINATAQLAGNNTFTGTNSFASVTDTGAKASSGTDCLQIDTNGAISNTGAACGSGSGGASTSTANTWTATQTFADGATLYPNGTATSTNNYASTTIQYQFSYWNGTAAVTDGWSGSASVGSGATPYSALDFFGPKTLTANLSVLYGLNPSIAATSTANYNSPSLIMRGVYWTGTASSQDSWYIDDALGTGANPNSTLVFSHGGTTGSATVQFPNLSVTGTANVQNLTVTGTCTGCGGGGGTTISDLGTLTYTASGTTTFAAASAGIAAAKVTATHSTSTTFVPTGLVKWGSYTVEIMQDATGGGVTFTLGTTGSCSAWKITGGGAGAITLSSSANAIDMLEFTYDGTNCVGSLNPNAN